MANPTLTFGVDLSEFNSAFNKINKTATTLSDVLDKNIKTATTAIKNANEKLSSGLNLSDMAKAKTQIDALGSKIKQMTKAKIELDIKDAKAKIWGLKEEAIASFGAIKLLSNPVKTAMDFEKSMVSVKKVVEFENSEDLKVFSNELIKLTRSVPKTMNELATITAEGAKMGIKKDELMDFTALVAKMSNAFEISAESASSNIATLKDIFKIGSIKEVEKFGDAINKVADSVNTTTPKMLDLLTSVGSAGKMINLDKMAVANLGGAFTALALDAGESATTMTKVFSVLGGSGNATAQARDAFKQLGIDIDDMKASFEKNGEKTLVNFFERLNGFDRFKKAELIKQLFGQEHIKNISTLVENMDKYKEIIAITSKEENYLNSIQEEDNRQKDSLAYKMAILKNNFLELSQKIGELFLPVVKVATTGLGSLTNIISSLVDKFPFLIQGLGVAMASLTALRVATIAFNATKYASVILLGSYKNLLSLLPMQCLKYKLGIQGCTSSNVKFGLSLATLRLQTALFLGSLKTALFSVTGGVKAFSLALFTTPIGWVILGVSALAFIVYKFWDNFKALFSGFISGFSTIKTAFINAFTPLEPMINTFKKAFEFLGVSFTPLINFLKELFTQNEATKESMDGWFSIGQIIGKVFASIFGMIATAISLITGFIGIIFSIPDGFEGVINAIKRLWNSIKGIWTSIWGDKEINTNISQTTTNKATAELNTPANQSTNGAIDLVTAKEQKLTTNAKTNQINDYKNVNVNLYGSSATPEQVVKAVNNNSYKFGDE